MLERVAKKTLLLSIIFVLLASIVFVGILSIDNKVSAEEQEPEDSVTIHPQRNKGYTLTHQNTYVDGSDLNFILFYGCTFTITETAESVTFYDCHITNSKITILPRTTDLYIYFDGFSISGYDQRTIVYNTSTEGTVHFVNIGSGTVSFTAKANTTADFTEANGVKGAFYTKGNISFEGNPFKINGGDVRFGTAFGSLDFGHSGMQVVGAKDVNINANVTITGGDGPDAITLFNTAYAGGHGGYAYDGALSRVHVSESGYLTLIGGVGGDGASVDSGYIPGIGGIGGLPYFVALNIDSNNYSVSNGENGHKGHTN
ncbi:MAG: hypothetical protein K5923_02475 [Clostridia bacterium]|nr:hypothetical protein [Clostridia bacterium]